MRAAAPMSHSWSSSAPVKAMAGEVLGVVVAGAVVGAAVGGVVVAGAVAGAAVSDIVPGTYVIV